VNDASDPAPLSDDDLCRNRLLRVLSPADRAMLAPHTVLVDLSRGAVLFQPGEDVTQVHLPCDSTMISLVVAIRGGEVAETGLIGCEGAVGGIISAGAKPAYARGVVQIAGRALCVDVAMLEKAKSSSPSLRDVFSRYADCLLAQFLQTIACNALHSLEQRFCRWLLAVADRHGDADLPLTQEYLGDLLGVQRTYVTKTASALQARGLIGYQRGRIRINDRAALMETACTCQTAIRDHYDRVAPGVYPPSVQAA
jgi:CRP-like cAMP-binding protein